ncbi:MAG: hypothetical protein R2854_02370 [Caldilineaceae bacterium]
MKPEFSMWSNLGRWNRASIWWAEELDVRTEVELTGLEIKWVHFRRRSQPLALTWCGRCRRPERAPSGSAPVACARRADRGGDVDEDSYYIFIGDGLFTGTELQRVVQFVGERRMAIG